MKILFIWLLFWCLVKCESRTYSTIYENVIINVPWYENYEVSMKRIPPANEPAKVARYIMHQSDWCSIASLSTINNIEGYPYANTYSIVDGPVDQSTGVPYLYLTKLEMTAKDIEKDNRVSISISMSQNDYCKTQKFDPEDPRCAHVTLIGKLVYVTDDEEENFAKLALFSRHPIMKTWPISHEFCVAKILLEKIVVMDAFGGPKFVTPEEYYAVPSKYILKE